MMKLAQALVSDTENPCTLLAVETVMFYWGVQHSQDSLVMAIDRYIQYTPVIGSAIYVEYTSNWQCQLH